MLIKEAAVDGNVSIAGADEESENAVHVERSLALFEPEEAIHSPPHLSSHAAIFCARVGPDKSREAMLRAPMGRSGRRVSAPRFS